MTSVETLVVLAVLVQMAYTYVAMVRTGRARFAAARARRTKGDIAIDSRAWPDDVLKLVNNMQNQFETPTLFYAMAILALVIDAASPIFALLAWGYVASRLVHGWIHTGTNDVMPRFRAFLAGLGCLMLMTLLLFVHALAGLVA